MDTGEWLTRGTVWLALSLYVAGEIVKTARRPCESGAVGRWLNSVGCTAFLAHVASAFQFYHDWSHSAAYADTARQTEELFGWNWGGGIYFKSREITTFVPSDPFDYASSWQYRNPCRKIINLAHENDPTYYLVRSG